MSTCSIKSGSIGIIINSSGKLTLTRISGSRLRMRCIASSMTSSTGSVDLFTLAVPFCIRVTVSRFSTMFKSQSASSPIWRTISRFFSGDSSASFSR